MRIEKRAECEGIRKNEREREREKANQRTNKNLKNKSKGARTSDDTIH